MSISLSLLDCALLLIKMLVCELLHLNAIRLIDESFDCIQLGRAPGRDSHVRHFRWR